MKIIGIEGLDKSGKHTVSKAITQYLKNKGFKVQHSEFHRYDTPTGKLIMDWLTNEWDVSQHTIELIMAADKQAQQEWIQSLENEGYDYLILDRYTRSQIVYGIVNGMDKMWLSEIQNYLRKPDMELYIDIPADVSMQRKGKHNNGENDRYESDKEMLERVRSLYLFMTDKDHKVEKIEGNQELEHVIEDAIGYVEKLIRK